MSRPYFSFGTARGGTNLLIKMLGVLPDFYAAMDPFLPLFKQYRNDVLSRSADAEIRAALDLNSPLDDYYFDPVKSRMLLEIQAASLSIPYPRENHREFAARMKPRTSLSSLNLADRLDELAAADYRGVFDAALRLIEDAAGPGQRTRVGLHENWAIEFLTPLARAYPDARFVLMLRDPRACIASALRVEDPRQIPHVLSFARNWRKTAAFVQHYLAHPVLKDRVRFLRYEDLVMNPEASARSICAFLELDFKDAMLDPRNFKDPSGGAWRGNSHQGAVPDKIYTSSLEAWRKSMTPEQIWAVELACHLEMTHFGYEPAVFDSDAPERQKQFLEFLRRDAAECQGWRVGIPDACRDFERECLRKKIVAREISGRDDAGLQRLCPEETRDAPDGWLRQNFLFPESLAALSRSCHA